MRDKLKFDIIFPNQE